MKGQMVNAFDREAAGSLDPEMSRLIAQRDAVLGPAYRLLYERPLRLVRGEGVYLYDADGNRFLDAYNNVPSVGHANPHVTEAIASQAARLNTNTRYVTEGPGAYAERLLASHDPEIERVMFTCSGSEAVDLALRIATFRESRRGIVVTENAYHGQTVATAEVSPNLGRGVRLGAHVRTVPAPRPGRDADPAIEFADAVAAAMVDLERHGFPPAALLVDSVFSSDGLWPDPPGLLGPAVEAARSAGALFIADEVQSGFNRTGEKMWGYQRHSVTPDLVTMGKPMGNGTPIGGLAAKGPLQDEFGRAARYFNTFGGNSVCIAAADAVLDVIETEGLAGNAVKTGEMIRSGLAELAAATDLIGDVRGTGLFLAADMTHPETGEPSAELALRLVNGLRDRGVLISATGPRGATLKIRPPLPFQPEHAELLLTAIADTVGELERDPRHGA